MSKKKLTANQLAWCCSFTGSHFDPYSEPLTFDELRDRIERNRGKKSKIFPQQLAWIRKIQPLKRWEEMWEPFDVDRLVGAIWIKSWNKKGKYGCLRISRHEDYAEALKQANYIDVTTPGTIYFQKGHALNGMNWLIKANEAPFVYALLKSSMFKAWCTLLANTGGKGRHKGHGDLTEGMWNTFPLPKLTKDQKDRIIKAGKNPKKLDEIIDALFNLHNPTDEERKNMLAKGFEKTFRDVK